MPSRFQVFPSCDTVLSWFCSVCHAPFSKSSEEPSIRKRNVDYEWFATFGLAKTQVSIYYPARVQSQLNSESMLTERPLPRTQRIRAITVAAVFAIFAGLIVWIVVRFGCDWLMGLPFVIALPVGYYFFCVRHCPECGSRLAYRREMLGHTTEYRWLARGDHCQIDWDIGIFDDTEHRAS
jgi:hypothetical protein